MFQRFTRYFGNVSDLLVIGICGILVVMQSLLLMNYKREKEYMVKILSEKEASLIRAFEDVRFRSKIAIARKSWVCNTGIVTRIRGRWLSLPLMISRCQQSWKYHRSP